jgi:hypothetical protein
MTYVNYHFRLNIHYLLCQFRLLEERFYDYFYISAIFYFTSMSLCSISVLKSRINSVVLHIDPRNVFLPFQLRNFQQAVKIITQNSGGILLHAVRRKYGRLV